MPGTRADDSRDLNGRISLNLCAKQEIHRLETGNYEIKHPKYSSILSNEFLLCVISETNLKTMMILP